MPTGHFKRSKEHCARIGDALKGRKKGPMAISIRRKIAKTLKGRIFSRRHRAKLRRALLGKKRAPFSEKWKRNISNGLRNRKSWKWPLLSRRRFSKSRKHSGIARGKNNPNWQGGITSLSAKLRSSDEYKVWRKAVFGRDKYRCRKCGKPGNGQNLQAHHKKPFCVLLRLGYMNLLWDPDNGVTLCVDCHLKTDNYGWKIWNKWLKKLKVKP